MGLESNGNYEQLQKVENAENLKYDLGFLKSSQNKLEGQIRDYVLQEKESGRDITQLTKDLNELVEKQRTENESLEKNIKSETKENLDKEALVNKAKNTIYEKLGIDNNLENNSVVQKFLKGFVDEVLIGNIDLAIEIYNTGGKVLIESLSSLASFEGLKQIAESLGENIVNLLSGNSYEKGKSFAELGIVSTGVGLGVAVGKKGLKLGIKQLSKMRLDKKTIVETPDVKDVIGDVNGKLDEILPKQELDFEKKLKDDIIDKGKEELLPDKQEVMKGQVNENVTNQATLYDNPQYDYLNSYKEVLGENIDISNVLGEGVNGIVLKHPTQGTVIKIRKPGMDKDDIGVEIDNHNRILRKLNELKSGDNPTVDKSVKIPRIKEVDNSYLKTFYTMEEIEGQTLSTRVFRNEHPGLKMENPDFLDTLTDRQIIELMTDKYGSSTKSLKKMIDSNKGKYLDEWLESSEGSKMKIALEMLKKEKIEHTDLHTGNIMIDKNGNTYLIDFGTAKVE